ncbi:polysaccharide biosynthesis/export family protein [Luteimonas sp. SJ-92]|uniref:Polysaccharide biosynthesis/export family protein n=2 Tax=Luteimonas salinisoli TaxID=2752307 RepID=A0A853JAR2_9GAMM|nr:polysaccharide biosynthesis/export family protein [Luteimonas salinisoli]
MSTSGLLRGDSPESGHVELVPITPKLLAMDQATRQHATVPQELLDYRPEPYAIGPGDTLYITVWDHPELTSPAGTQQQPQANGRLVRPDGTLFYPYIGTIQAGGSTIEQLRDTITERLARFVESPQVDVSVIGYDSQKISLQGAFVDTTPQPVTAVPLTLSQAIGNAGIDTGEADLSGLVLTRDGSQYALDLDALNRERVAADIHLRPGDHLHLPFNDRKEVYVVGEVTRPQTIGFKTTDMSLTQALGRAGGLNPLTSKGKAVYVIRGVEDIRTQTPTVYSLDARSPASYVLADGFRVRAGDVVFVGPAGVTRWNRFLSQLLPLSSIVNNATNVRDNLGSD